jgi:WD40 repeat protein
MGNCNNSANDQRREREKNQKNSLKSNNIEQNNENQNQLKENNLNLKEQDNNMNNVNNMNNMNNMNYYLICPDCLIRSPHIEKLYYDENSKDFLVKYTCICSMAISKETPLMKILDNKEPLNLCTLHQNNKLIGYCDTCKRAICSTCKQELHIGHKINMDTINKSITRENADNMLKIIKEKEQKFNEDIHKNEEKMENGIDNMIQKLNNEKLDYKKQLENYKDNNLKTFEFLKNLYGRYINNFENNQKSNNLDQNNLSANPANNNVNNDIMLANHINKFTIDNKMPKLNSNVDEIINQYNEEQKELKLKYDYGFPFNNSNSIDLSQNKISELNTLKSKKEFICTKTFEGHIEKIVSLIQLSSGKIASGSYDNTIRIWNMDSLKEDKIINESGRVFTLLEFEKDKLLAGTSDNVINIWDVNPTNNSCLFSFSGHELWINCLVKINNLYFASASNDAKIKIWDYYKRKCLCDLTGHKDCILTLILLKNNYLCSGSADLTIKIWDWEKGKCLSTLRGHQKWVKCVFELDNGVIVSGSDDKTIKLWKDYNLISTLDQHKHSVRTFCQINKNYFASGSFDCTIKIWNINTLECFQTLIGHNSNIICIISLNNKDDNPNKSYSIASCSNDKTIKIWEGIL